jgi:hypothetical protein
VTCQEGTEVLVMDVSLSVLSLSYVDIRNVIMLMLPKAHKHYESDIVGAVAKDVG